VVTEGKLLLDLLAARQAAVEATSGVEDMGTCNLDYPILYLSSSPDVMAAIGKAGFLPIAHAGKIRLAHCPGWNTQGFPRTLGAEAVARVLAERGWKSDVRYIID
jgi:hypothetical protein